jgi:3,4-dihydroxy-9,10-secoandrosta-1,3,5(10)-triene-9,17-dione 4,5-dioxygenase
VQERTVGDVDGLGYLGLTGSVVAWREFAGIIGLQTAPQVADREVRFRVDERAWRIAVEEGEPGIAYIGWEAQSQDALDRIREKLSAAGVSVKTDPELAAERNVLEVFSCEDPSGLRLEFFFGPEVISEPFVSPTGARFVTSIDGRSLGLGHVVLFVDEIEATRKLYTEVLGFELSDAIIHGAMRSNFTHVNPRHHSLAFGAAMGPMKKGLNHFMLEVDSLDVVGVALDRLTAAGFPLTVTLGKHSNDHMTSFYVRTPSGCDLEYGVGGRLLDDSWVPTWFRSPSIWGHKRVPLKEESP